jgi:hypothetical protein
MKNQSEKRTLLAAYRVTGFRVRARVEGGEEGSAGFVVTLDRRQKKRHAAGAERPIVDFTTGGGIGRGIWIAAGARCGSISRCGAWTAKRAA